jgi:hypothetical protein
MNPGTVKHCYIATLKYGQDIEATFRLSAYDSQSVLLLLKYHLSFLDEWDSLTIQKADDLGGKTARAANPSI